MLRSLCGKAAHAALTGKVDAHGMRLCLALKIYRISASEAS